MNTLQEFHIDLICDMHLIFNALIFLLQSDRLLF